MPDEYLMNALSDLADTYTPELVIATAKAMWPPVVPSTPSRAGDRDTSIDSGARKASPDLGRFSQQSHPGRLLLHFQHTEATALEATMTVLPPEARARPSVIDGCRRRVSDLAAVGYIEDSKQRRCNEFSPDPSVVWRITLAGEHAVRRLLSSGWSKPKTQLREATA